MALDFTSALYLGLRHESGALEGWDRLTPGAPAALREDPRAALLAPALAALIGCERAVLATSTLHAFTDVLATLAGAGTEIHWDAGVYPIARWVVERMQGRGVAARPFPHHDPDALSSAIQGSAARPIVVADGFCPRCGSAAPVARYLEAARTHGGTLVLDDTQALGIFGAGKGVYGAGGGGTLRHAGVGGADVLVVASLAKAFGAPLAAIAGSSSLVRRIEEDGEARMHCSGPDAASIAAAFRALAVNQARGDAMRDVLADRVRRLRLALRRAGLRLSQGLFPMQLVRPPRGQSAAALHRRLEESGVRSVLVGRNCAMGPAVALLVTALHAPADIDCAAAAAAKAVGLPRERRVANPVTGGQPWL
ncbi:MAG: aminotransferase class I/II-fold pyridoxal phosphate-dependent enzyme [Deltaproteobacteria bacterium]